MLIFETHFAPYFTNIRLFCLQSRKVLQRKVKHVINKRVLARCNLTNKYPGEKTASENIKTKDEQKLKGMKEEMEAVIEARKKNFFGGGSHNKHANAKARMFTPTSKSMLILFVLGALSQQ